MTDYAELRKRVESASGPDRKIDYDLLRFFDPERAAHFDEYYTTSLAVAGLVESRGKEAFLRVAWASTPDYTASLDAALALVEAKLPGWGWSVTTKERWSWACVNEPSAKVEIVRGEAPTPALALLSALLAALSEVRP